MKVFSVVAVYVDGVDVCRAFAVVTERPFWEVMRMVTNENEEGFRVDGVMYLGLDVEKANAGVDPELNVPFDRAVYDAEFGLVRVTELIVVICEANEFLEWGNIEGKLGR